jgi:diguanylate cyclase (GGDEF)-like protein
MAAVSLVDRDRQWFKSIQGLDATETPRSVAFCAHTILQAVPLVVEDATLDPRFAANPIVIGEPHIRSYAGVPLRSSEGYNLGSLCGIDTVPREFQVAELELLKSFAALVVDEIELRTIAQLDHLTGAMTRRAFAEQAKNEVERFTRYQRPVSLIMFDLDHFKTLNDTWGHPFGDEVLSKVADAVRSTLRPPDMFARYGGEEFVALLPETNATEALLCAERMRATIANVEYTKPERVTASFGISELGGTIDSLAALVAQADAALYEAKRNGRDRCLCASSLLHGA